MQPQALDPGSWPHLPKNNYRDVPATIENVAHMLTSYDVKVGYDVIKKRTFITIPDHTGTVDNAENTTMTIIVSLAALNSMPIGPIPAIVEALADRNPFNPAKHWMLSRPWDGVDRLPAFFQTLTIKEGFSLQLARTLIYKWLLSIVAAAVLERGFKARGVLTLQGPQGIGKTSWIMALVPEPTLRDALVKVDHHLDPHNKDSILGAIRHLIVELGEVDSTLRKSDVSRMKGVLTADTDKVRRPYARSESEYPRRTVFCATVNEENFLVDHTGNTRWWTLPVEAIDFKHGIDMQQLFAQLAVDLEADEQWWLTQDEEKLLEAHNREHRTTSLLREKLLEILDLGKVGQLGLKAMGSVELLNMLGVDRPTNGDTKELTGLLRELIGPSTKVRGTQKWRVPLRDTGPVVDIDDLDEK